MRWAARADTTQGAIVAGLRAVGAHVHVLRNEPFDLLVCHRQHLYMMDCKTPVGKAGTIRKKPSQVALELEGWPIHYPRTVDEALTMIGVLPKPMIYSCRYCAMFFFTPSERQAHEMQGHGKVQVQ